MLTEYNGEAITYDTVGNPLTYRDGITMTWQNGRELATLTKDNKTISYTYDANGMRTEKNSDGTVTQYFYDGNNNLTSLKRGDTQLVFYYDTEGQPESVAHYTDYVATRYYYVKNLQGDIVKIVSDHGTVIANYEYDAYGKLLSITSSTGAEITSESSIALLNPLRYRGYVYDDDTGLYYLQSRYYDPEIGRFINADSTAILALSLLNDDSVEITNTNLFAYCYNNPTMRTDKTGFIAIVDDTLVWAVIALFVYCFCVCVVSTSAFKNSWVNFCTALGNGLSSIWSNICGATSAVWNWSVSKLKKAYYAVSLYVSASQADANIRSKVKNSSSNKYWIASLNGGYVTIGKSITFSQAKKRVQQGKNVFTTTKARAKELAKSAYGGKKPVGPEIDKGKENVIGYYYHYHVYGRSNSAHVFFLFW